MIWWIVRHKQLMRFRQGGFVNLPDDYKEDPLPRIDREYY